MSLFSYISLRRLGRFWTKVKTYINGKIEDIDTFDQVVVDTLPEIGEYKTLYFVPKQDGESGDYYDEYIWARAKQGGQAAHWERVGSTNYVPDHTIADDTDNPGYLVLNIGDDSFAIERTKLITPILSATYNNVAITSGGNNSANPIVTTTSTASINVSCSNVEGAVIYYTLDGSDPTTESSQFAGSMQLYIETGDITPVTGQPSTYTVTFKAKAFANGRGSQVFTYTFYITRKLKQPTITITAPSGSGISGTATLSKVTDYSQDIYYTTNNTEPTVSSTKYTSPFSVNSNTKIRAKAFKANWNDSEEATPVQQKFTVKKPSITEGGTFSTTKSVELGGTTIGATIRYTTDGLTPTSESTAYSSAISVTKTNTTIKAKAFLNNDWNDSEVAESTFVLKVDKPTISVDSDDVYATSHTITITAPSQTGTTVYYTTDNSDPASSGTRQTYSAPFAIGTRGTFAVKAVAVKTDWTSNSDSKSNIVVAKRYTHVLLTDSTDTPSETTIEAAAMASPAENPIGTYPLNNSGSTEKQMWICVPKAYGHTIPNNGVTNDDGWTQPITSSETTNYYAYRVGAGLGGGSSITLKVISVN